MLAPIRLNSDLAIAKILPFLPSLQSPKYITYDFHEYKSIDKYLSSVSALKFNSTFKTTGSNRHLLSNQLLQKYLPENSVILDMGASAGTTSKELMLLLNFKFKKYYVSDANIEVKYFKDKNGRLFFYNENDDCILVASRCFISYPQELKAVKRFFKKSISENLQKAVKVPLIDPELQEFIRHRDNIFFKKQSIFEPWKFDTPNVIIVANLLNRSYFDDEKLLQAIANLKSIIADDGYLLIVENRNSEQGGLYQKQDLSFVLVENIGKGSDIHELIVR